jgi:hypothetical protein
MGNAGQPYRRQRFEIQRRYNIYPTVNRCGCILFLRFELPDEGSEMRRDGGREGIVLVLEALPNR